MMRRLPEERVMYFADNAHVPYGERPLEQIQEFALAITDFLVQRGAKAVVMACNMSSAVALQSAQDLFPDIPVLGVIFPGARAAVRQAKGRPIGVLATTGTVNSGAYPRAIRAIDQEVSVFQQACPKFVPLVESGNAETEEAEAAAREYTARLVENAVSTVVLGCTHYPFLRKVISSSLGDDISLVDPAEETVEELQKLLNKRDLLANTQKASAEHRYFASGEPGNFRELGTRLLGRRIESVERAVWGCDLGKVLV